MSKEFKKNLLEHTNTKKQEHMNVEKAETHDAATICSKKLINLSYVICEKWCF